MLICFKMCELVYYMSEQENYKIQTHKAAFLCTQLSFVTLLHAGKGMLGLALALNIVVLHF